MTKTAKKIGGTAVALALIVGIGFGVPEYRKAKADALVSNLCAKDGGVHIYTTVKLPPSRFNRYGEAFFPGRWGVAATTKAGETRR